MAPTIHLTSFKRWHAGPGIQRGLAYSIAVYQPKWLPQLDVAPVFNILNEERNWIRPRDFIPPDHDGKPNQALLRRYYQALTRLYDSREEQIQQFLRDHRLNSHIYLCCWCPYDRAAQRQIKDFGSFVCHAAVVGSWLVEHGVRVMRDKPRVAAS